MVIIGRCNHSVEAGHFATMCGCDKSIVDQTHSRRGILQGCQDDDVLDLHMYSVPQNEKAL